VIGGKGRFLYQEILGEKDRVATTNLLSEAQIARKVAQNMTTSQEKSFQVVLFNDNLSDEVRYTVEWYALLPAHWTHSILIDGIVRTSGYVLPVAKKSKKEFEIKITVPANQPAGRIGTVILRATDTDVTEEGDAIVAQVATWFAEYEDVKREIESLIIDESIFPPGLTYSSRQVVEQYLGRANLITAKFVCSPWSTEVKNLEIGRHYAILRVIRDILVRSTVYAYRGAETWVGSISVINGILKELESEMSY